MKNTKLPVAAALVACAFSIGALSTTEAQARGVQRGAASWYGPGFHGKKTASGERFNANAMTAAHRSLPFGTKVRVVNERTGRAVTVRINDRGPFHGGRIIDLAAAPARVLGIAGTTYVSLHPGG